MTYGSLEEPAEKLRWAAEQYREIKNNMGGADHQSIRLRVEGSDDGLRYDMYAGDVPSLPVNLSLMIGDVYHNLRGALDYLVYQLHERHYRGKIPPSAVRDCQFPILSQHRVMKGGVLAQADTWSEIKRLGKQERNAIAWLQPYKSRKDSLKGVRIHLHDISAINNIDKHRRLHITRSMAQAVPSMASLPDCGLTQNPAFGVPIETGSRIDTWIFDQRPSIAIMSGVRSFRTGAIFDLSGERIDALPHMVGSITSVKRVIERFGALFPALPAGILAFRWVRVTEPIR
jgi:hypothetical protein